ncbi:Hypothetical predicted protein [Olea europaea subsp. europaea]|uniref:Uncharacterized protein n=1 Tax=Olea europaea subsp. europaea TaxID=158383 RepID=A0A8S0PCC7_OLEEU|nr:Hypothetical predicted protein [Olea europaea subsp. europaea]
MGGKALHRHKKKMKLSSITKWENYTHQMGLKFRALGSGMENEHRETDATPLINTKGPRRRIYKLRGASDEEIPKLKEPRPRFGPFYCNEESSSLSSIKEMAWQHFLKNYLNRAAETIENY